MKCLVLAAGYATRLYPLTENFPKPLLEVGGKPILDWLLDDIIKTSSVDECIIVSNHRFASHFREWAQGRHHKVTVVDDGTSTNETRLGAVCDIRYAVGTLGIDDDLMVIAGDNVLDFSLGSFIGYAASKGTSCVMRYSEASKEKLRKCGVMKISDDDVVTSMVEKPENPESTWCCPPFYCFTREDVKRIGEGIEAGCGTDAPGSFIAWLSSVTTVHAMLMPGSRYDVGNLESYQRIRSQYNGPIK